MNLRKLGFLALLVLAVALLSQRAWGAANCVFYGSGQCDGANFTYDPSTHALTVSGGVIGSGGGTTPTFLTGTASETPGALSAGCADQSSTIALTGAAVGDACMVGVPAAGAGTGVTAACYISATSVATVRLCTMTGTPTGTTGTYRATVVH